MHTHGSFQRQSEKMARNKIRAQVGKKTKTATDCDIILKYSSYPKLDLDFYASFDVNSRGVKGYRNLKRDVLKRLIEAGDIKAFNLTSDSTDVLSVKITFNCPRIVETLQDESVYGSKKYTVSSNDTHFDAASIAGWHTESLYFSKMSEFTEHLFTYENRNDDINDYTRKSEYNKFLKMKFNVPDDGFIRHYDPASEANYFEEYMKNEKFKSKYRYPVGIYKIVSIVFNTRTLDFDVEMVQHVGPLDSVHYNIAPSIETLI
jgi:hypothetical protein